MVRAIDTHSPIRGYSLTETDLVLSMTRYRSIGRCLLDSLYNCGPLLHRDQPCLHNSRAPKTDARGSSDEDYCVSQTHESHSCLSNNRLRLTMNTWAESKDTYECGPDKYSLRQSQLLCTRIDDAKSNLSPYEVCHKLPYDDISESILLAGFKVPADTPGTSRYL